MLANKKDNWSKREKGKEIEKEWRRRGKDKNKGKEGETIRK